MENNASRPIAVIDDDPRICEIITNMLSFRGYQCESFTDPRSALARHEEKHFRILLLDIMLNGDNGLSFIKPVMELCSSARVIVMTGFADKEMVVQALKLGAFDFLEKPLQTDLLIHTVNRALQEIDRDEDILRLIDDLKAKQARLMQQNEQLDYLNNQLMETNRALSVLAQNIEREREETERRIALRLKSLILPSIEKLRRDKSLSAYRADLDLLVGQIEDLTSGFSTDARIASLLSFTEMRVASLIRNGLTSEEIAEQLHISVSTVRTHRKNIRKKLRINNGRYSLRNYLAFKSSRRGE